MGSLERRHSSRGNEQCPSSSWSRAQLLESSTAPGLRGAGTRWLSHRHGDIGCAWVLLGMRLHGFPHGKRRVDLGLFCGFLLDTGGEHLIPRYS